MSSAWRAVCIRHGGRPWATRAHGRPGSQVVHGLQEAQRFAHHWSTHAQPANELTLEGQLLVGLQSALLAEYLELLGDIGRHALDDGRER
jgi:hypothetical protein